jgi:ribonuclease HI
MKARISFDGGGQAPGPTVAAAVVELDDGTAHERTRRYRTGTHNTAEYHALSLGLEAALALGVRRVQVQGDSRLVVEQVNGRSKVKNAKLRELHSHACALLDRFEEWELTHVPRAQNRRADELGRRSR